MELEAVEEVGDGIPLLVQEKVGLGHAAFPLLRFIFSCMIYRLGCLIRA
jgi:hypothetical protein